MKPYIICHMMSSDYSKCGDKIWYTQDNLMDFLNRTNINNN